MMMTGEAHLAASVLLSAITGEMSGGSTIP
jgi:hypothetical protein